MRQNSLAMLLIAIAACNGGDAGPSSAPKSSIACSSDDLHAKDHGACDPMEARAIPDPQHGSCYSFLGYAFDGSECVALADCSCAGEDCDELTRTKEQCEERHAHCLGSSSKALAFASSPIPGPAS